MKHLLSWVGMTSILLLFSFQNCSPGHLEAIESDDGFTPKVFEASSENGSREASSTLAEIPGAGEDSPSGSTAVASASGGKAKVGINIGVYMSQNFVDSLGNTGTWYYNYSPHPNRQSSYTTYNTVNWANKYGKEFVPMISGKWFKLGTAEGGCTLIEEFAEGAGETICDVGTIGNTLLNMKKQFGPSNQPKYLLAFNEPYKKGADDSSGGYAMDPTQSAKAFAKIQKAAKAAGLTLVSPSLSSTSLGSTVPGWDWMATFLKACYARRADPALPCDINGIAMFQIHDYQCTENFWTNNYANGAWRKGLVSRLNGYGGVDWAGYLAARAGWVTETNCNWDPDFLTAQGAGQYIRTQRESCLRATGQKSGYGKGSLAALTSMPNGAIFRFAWWNTYANPETNSDVGAVTASSRTASRRRGCSTIRSSSRLRDAR